jgi:hypothetical protein
LQITSTGVILTFLPDGTWQLSNPGLNQPPEIWEDIVEEPDGAQIDAVVLLDELSKGRASWGAIVSVPTASTWSATVSFDSSKVSRDFEQTSFVGALPGH